MGETFKGIVGGVTDIFTGREAQEGAEDVLNATIRGREAIGAAGKELREFYDPFTEAAEPSRS